MNTPLPIKAFGDHHAPVETPRYVTLLHLGLIAVVAFAIWGFIFELLPMD